jgi:hypothetical protein
VLLTHRDPPRALSIPVLYFGAGLGILIVSIAALIGGASPWGAGGGVLLGAASVAIALGSVRLITTDANALTVRGIKRRLALDRDASAFGVRLHTSHRSASYVVFVTDGSVQDDVAEFMSETSARGAIARLEKQLLGGTPEPGERSRRRGAAAVRSVEKEWRTRVGEGQKVIDAYYASPAWARAKYGVIALVVVYSLAMLIYGALQP